MNIQLIRNATLKLIYAGHQFIIDPYLAPKHSLPAYANKSPNPLVDLPFSAEEIISGVEMVIVSHLHTDHFDTVAKQMLPKTLPIFCQPGDEAAITAEAFTNVTPIHDKVMWHDVQIARTEGQHGVGDTLKLMGNVSGFVFEAADEPTVYWAGDTIWYDGVAQVIEEIQPDIIITHSCGAVWGESEPIVMDAVQTVAACQAAPNSIVIATHMEALDHATISREALRAYANQSGVAPTQLLIPQDGELIRF